MSLPLVTGPRLLIGWVVLLAQPVFQRRTSLSLGSFLNSEPSVLGGHLRQSFVDDLGSVVCCAFVRRVTLIIVILFWSLHSFDLLTSLSPLHTILPTPRAVNKQVPRRPPLLPLDNAPVSCQSSPPTPCSTGFLYQFNHHGTAARATFEQRPPLQPSSP